MKKIIISSDVYTYANSKVFSGKAGETVGIVFSNCLIDRYFGGRIYTLGWKETGFKM